MQLRSSIVGGEYLRLAMERVHENATDQNLRGGIMVSCGFVER